MRLTENQGADNGSYGAGDSNGEVEVSLRQRIVKPQTLISFGVAVAIILFLVTRLDIDVGATVRNIRSANPAFYGLAFLVYYLGFPIRAARWRILLHNVAGRSSQLPSVLSLARVLFLGWFANCLVVAKLGDIFRAYLLKRETGISFSWTAGTILAERIIDLVSLLTLMSLSALTVLSSLEQASRGATWIVFLVGISIVVAIALGLILMRHGGALVERLLPHRLRSAYGRFSHGTLGSFRRLPVLAMVTIGVWACEAGSLLLITRALGTRISVPMVIFVALAGSLLTSVPGLPGGLALVEGGMAGALSLVASQSDAISIAILYRTISYWSLVILGLALYLLSGQRGGRQVVAGEAAEAPTGP